MRNQSIWTSATVITVGGLAAVAMAGGPIGDPIPEPIEIGEFSITLDEVCTGLTAPNWGAPLPGHPDRMVVTDQDGVVWNVDLSTGIKTVFLDVTSRLVPLGLFGKGSFDERGLLGIAMHPDYPTNGLLYTYTSEPADPIIALPDFTTMPAGTLEDHHSVITEWRADDPADPLATADPFSPRVLMRIAQPQFNHNAGAISFGPDGMLYIATGDGGGADDRDGQDFIGEPIVGHGVFGNGQKVTNPLGKILRIDPLGTNSANGEYGIPDDNPLVPKVEVASSGIEVREIYAWGLRNPFRCSFDQQTGEFYIADVGQNDIEEINIGVSGANYGWNLKEGTFFFDPNGNDSGFITDVDPGVQAGLVDPIAQYDHDEGIAIVGGFVYRACNIPGLNGRYVFGEFAISFSNDGRLFYLDETNTIREFEIIGDIGLPTQLNRSLLGFGQDAAGQVYALVNETGTPFGNTGAILRLAPLEPFCPEDCTPPGGNGQVNIDDLLTVVVATFSNDLTCDIAPVNQDCSLGNGIVYFDDILAVINNFGPCDE